MDLFIYVLISTATGQIQSQSYYKEHNDKTNKKERQIECVKLYAV
jgi:hypothetical protein